MAVDTKPDPQEVLKEPTTPTIVSPTVDVQRNNILRIKTKYCFKDIPNKIVLGKTVNGNNLVARVVKRSCNNYIRNSIPPDSSSNSTTIAKKARNIEIESPSSRSECQRQIEQTLPRNTQETEYVAAANEVIMQLLQIPAFQPSLTRHNVIITRAKTTKDGRNIPVNHSNTVTGSVEPIEGEDGRWKLVHKPNLLQQLHSELEQYMKDENASNDKTKTLEDFSVLHVHVAEKNENGTDSVSITLNKRQLPFKLSTFFTTCEVKKPSKLYACSSCASIFRNNRELLEHQEIHSLENKLTIDTDKIDLMDKTNMKPYYVIKSKTGTRYSCLQCPMHFNKITNCQRHVKTHQRLANNKKDSKEPKSNKVKEHIYQCSLCPSSYHHPSSLTKHFTGVHVKAQVQKESRFEYVNE